MFIKRNIQTLREWWQSPVTIKDRAVGALVGGIEGLHLLGGFHDDNVAVPIIDRIIHHSHIFMLGGESYRLKQKAAG